MSKLTITKVEFKRIILHLHGEVTDVENLEDVKLLFHNRKPVRVEGESTVKWLDVKDVLWDGTHFEARINVLGLNRNYPLPSGHWYLEMKVGDADPVPAYVSDHIYERIYLSEMDGTRTDLMIDKSPTNYWYGSSRLKKKDWTYYLEVLFQRPEKKNWGQKLLQNFKRSIKRRIRLIRKWGFDTYFNLCNNLIKKNGKRVFFTSDRSDQLAGNEKFVYERMVERGLDKKYDISFDFKNSINASRSLINKFRFTKKLATADYVFLDDYQPEIYRNDFDENVKVIQLWHAAGAFKTIGFERVSTKDGPAFMTRVHKCYTHIPVSSDHSGDHNAEAFCLDRSKFYPVGIPRTDVFFDENYLNASRKKVHEAYPRIAEANKVYLYAPTFRGKNARTANFPLQIINFHTIGDFLKSENAVMVLKMHPFVTTPIEIPEEYAPYFINATDYPDINEMLTVTDVLITDYSSVIYEAALLHIPMLFFAFDLDTYDDDRGFYEPYEDIVPGKIITSLRGLIVALERKDYEEEKLDGFLTKNFKYLDGHSTDRTIDLIFGNEDGNSLA